MSENNEALAALKRVAQVVRTRIEQAQADGKSGQSMAGHYSAQRIYALTEIEGLLKDELYKLMIQKNDNR